MSANGFQGACFLLKQLTGYFKRQLWEKKIKYGKYERCNWDVYSFS